MLECDRWNGTWGKLGGAICCVTCLGADRVDPRATGCYPAQHTDCFTLDTVTLRQDTKPDYLYNLSSNIGTSQPAAT